MKRLLESQRERTSIHRSYRSCRRRVMCRHEGKRAVGPSASRPARAVPMKVVPTSLAIQQTSGTGVGDLSYVSSATCGRGSAGLAVRT